MLGILKFSQDNLFFTNFYSTADLEMMHTWMVWAVLASLTVCALSTGDSLQPQRTSTDVGEFAFRHCIGYLGKPYTAEVCRYFFKCNSRGLLSCTNLM